LFVFNLLTHALVLATDIDWRVFQEHYLQSFSETMMV